MRERISDFSRSRISVENFNGRSRNRTCVVGRVACRRNRRTRKSVARFRNVCFLRKHSLFSWVSQRRQGKQTTRIVIWCYGRQACCRSTVHRRTGYRKGASEMSIFVRAITATEVEQNCQTCSDRNDETSHYTTGYGTGVGVGLLRRGRT